MKYVIPILVAALLAYALIRRVNPYEAFIRGAADAVPTLLRVLPALAAMLGAITLLRGCGALDARQLAFARFRKNRHSLRAHAADFASSFFRKRFPCASR